MIAVIWKSRINSVFREDFPRCLFTGGRRFSIYRIFFIKTDLNDTFDEANITVECNFSYSSEVICLRICLWNIISKPCENALVSSVVLCEGGVTILHISVGIITNGYSSDAPNNGNSSASDLVTEERHIQNNLLKMKNIQRLIRVTITNGQVMFKNYWTLPMLPR